MKPYKTVLLLSALSFIEAASNPVSSNNFTEDLDKADDTTNMYKTNVVEQAREQAARASAKNLERQSKKMMAEAAKRQVAEQAMRRLLEVAKIEGDEKKEFIKQEEVEQEKADAVVESKSVDDEEEESKEHELKGEEPEVIEKCFKAVTEQQHPQQQQNRKSVPSPFAAPIPVTRKSIYNPAAATPQSNLNKSMHVDAAPRRSVREAIEDRRDKGVNFDEFQFYSEEERDEAWGRDQKVMFTRAPSDDEDDDEVDYFDATRRSDHQGRNKFSLGPMQRQRLAQDQNPKSQQAQQQRQVQAQQQRQAQAQQQMQNIQQAQSQQQKMQNIQQAQSQQQRLTARELQKLQEARQSQRYSARSSKVAASTKIDQVLAPNLSGIKLTFCQSAALGVIASFRLMGLKYPHQASSLERQKSTQYVVSTVNNFPCEKERGLMRQAMVISPPIYSDRRLFNKWASQFSKMMIKAMNSPVGLDMNSALIPLENDNNKSKK